MENDPVRIPITDELDLHLFQPRDYPELLQDYLKECLKAGIFEVRIVHGKGTGFQRRRVREILSELSMVAAFQDAPPQSGGWGATIAILKPAPGRETSNSKQARHPNDQNAK